MNTGERVHAHTQAQNDTLTHPNSARGAYHMPYTVDKASNTKYFKIYTRDYTVYLIV